MLKYYCANIGLLDNQQIFDEFFQKMNTKRRNKILRCKNEMDRRRSLLAGVLLKYALEKEGLDYDTLTFSESEDGKPVLSDQIDIHFSISHANAYVGCLISDVPVGVDLESMEKSLFLQENEKKLQAMAEKCLSPAEMKKFLSSKDRKKTFLECWTKKESYSKAKGKGLKMDFSLIDTEDKTKVFWSTWTTDGYCVSMYKEDEDYENLYIEKIKNLSI